jgi:hypothetical protein
VAGSTAGASGSGHHLSGLFCLARGVSHG